jgi:hypothetical protein
MADEVQGASAMKSVIQRVLLLDGFDVSTEAVSGRLRELGFDAVRAKTPDEGLQLTGEDPAIAAVLLPSDLPPAELGSFVHLLRGAATGRRLAFLAVGPRPGPEARQAFRGAGVELALWEPFDDATLRFQTNRALAIGGQQHARRALRVPCNAPVRAHAGGREKPGRLYTVSERGAFLETARASMRGSEVFLDLQLDSTLVQADSRVTSTNVPGNLRNPRLPVGIALEFTRLSAGGEQAIREIVQETARSLRIEADDADASGDADGRLWRWLRSRS